MDVRFMSKPSINRRNLSNGRFKHRSPFCANRYFTYIITSVPPKREPMNNSKAVPSPIIIPSLIIPSSSSSFGMSPSLPKTYKAAIFKAKNQPLTIEEVELKEPTEGEIIIKVLACGVCRADHHVQDGSMGSPL